MPNMSSKTFYLFFYLFILFLFSSIDGGTQIDTVAGSRNVQAKASVAAADSFDDLKRPAVDSKC